MANQPPAQVHASEALDKVVESDSGPDPALAQAMLASVLRAFGTAPFGKPSQFDGADLWDAEAAHRANNLAQLASSLCSFARRNGVFDLNRVDRLSRELATLYAEIGAPSTGAPLPCAEPLRDLVTALVDLFGPTVGAVRVQLAAEPLELEGDRRRAFLLIASEFTVNALRHAFKDADGLLVAHLARVGDCWRLAICDDGVGLTEAVKPGHGSGLVLRLARTLSGSITVKSSPDIGTCAELRFPAARADETCR